ncbi:helix-turn-helix domain-containing protein [Streptomyces sp. BR123]|nr:helix-turn-helix domain-containing protein [Streptomyces sp. BR123]
MFEDGVSNAEIARAVGVCAESVRRWRRAWEEGGASALRRRAATGRPPKLTTPRSRSSGPRWSGLPRPIVSRLTCGPWSESAPSLSG